MLLLHLLLLLLGPAVSAQPSRGHVQNITSLSGPDVFYYQWIGHNLYAESDFRTRLVRSARAAENRSTVDCVYCRCMLSYHWPHFLQGLLPCWHYFQLYPRARWFVTSYGMSTRFFEFRIHPLNISYKVATSPECPVELTVQYTKGKVPRDGWRDSEGMANFLSVDDASSYRSAMLKVLQNLSFHPRLGEGPPQLPSSHPPQRLRVGVLNRKGTRRVENAQELAEGLRVAHPNFHVEVLNDMQDLIHYFKMCSWINSQDVILSPHGAQLFNLPCAAPCTVLIELFPPRYFRPGSVQPLANALGLLPFGVYPGSSPYNDTAPCQKTFECREAARKATLRWPAGVTRLLALALRARRRCCHERSCWPHATP